MEILAEVGFCVPEENLLSRLAKAGFIVDKETKMVRLTQDLLDTALKSLPKDVALLIALAQMNWIFNNGSMFHGSGDACQCA